MKIIGINDSSHDAAVTVVENGKIVFAAHGERYNKQKNTFRLPVELLNYVVENGPPDVVAYFESRTKKRIRRLLRGGVNGDYSNLYRNVLGRYRYFNEIQVPHHYSHACAGYFTSTFHNATIVVVDAIGEFDTATVWEADGNYIRKKGALKYPTSFGLFYSAFTHLVGLKPNEEEYILMGMAAYGDYTRYIDKINNYFPSWNKQLYNFHQGIVDWDEPIISQQDKCDIAAAVQKVYEARLIQMMRRVRASSVSKNLVFMGGCALNCSANTKLLDIWNEVWIMPNPGDAGSSMGAALAVHNQHVRWTGPYLGHEISGSYPINAITSALRDEGMVGVAALRAEFGPRALGNRSILADPRSREMRDRVNAIKGREQFRPFAPVILEEHAAEWFDIDRPVPYMQFAVKCRKPDLIPAVVHADGTSRIQTVNRYQHAGLTAVLERWHEMSGVPVLLNTSLNVKGQPLLNDVDDLTLFRSINPSLTVVS